MLTFVCFFAWIIIIIKDTVQDPKGHYLLCRQKWQYGKATVFIAVHISVRPILRIGEYSLAALQHRRIRYIGLRVSADAE